MTSIRREVLITAGGLTIAALGIVIQIVGDADYPTVPPGLIIAVVGTAVVVLVRRRWAFLITLLMAAFLIVGGIITPDAREHLGEPAALGRFIGTIVQLAGVALTLVGSIAGLRRSDDS